MNSNKTNKNSRVELQKPPSTKETVVEVCPEGVAHLTTINNIEEWEHDDDDDLQGLVSTQNTISLVSRLWGVYIIIIIIMICTLFYIFARDGGPSVKHKSKSGEPWTFDI